MIRRRIGPTILEINLKFQRELRNRQRIIIKTWMDSYAGKIGRVGQQIRDPDGNLCCDALFTIGLFDLGARKLILPDARMAQGARVDRGRSGALRAGALISPSNRNNSSRARNRNVRTLPPMSTIHFIGGEKGGVGKSVVARLCAQYCIDRALPFVAADADGSHGALLRFYADYARPIDLTDAASADQLLELATEEDRRVVVDLPAQSDRLVSAWIDEAGILELAAESGVKVVFWHVIDDGKDSLVTLGRLLARYGGRAKFCVVKNARPGEVLHAFRRVAHARQGGAARRRDLRAPRAERGRRCRRSIAGTPASGRRRTGRRCRRRFRASNGSA